MKFSLNVWAILATAASLNSCKHTQSNASRIQSNMTANVGEIIWQNHKAIPVCWERATQNQLRSVNQPDGASEEELKAFREKVQLNVTSEYARAGIGFVGWQECNEKSPGMHVLLGGESARVRDFARLIDGAYAGIIISDPKAAGEYALQGAMHEFGHALGLRHEASRVEGFKGCKDYAYDGGEPGTFSIGPYDADSLMNYCLYDKADPNNEDALARLSPGDVSSLVNIYRGTIAELSTPLPYVVGVKSLNLDVKNVSNYRYKYGAFDETSCQSPGGYSTSTPISQAIPLINLPAGEIRLCIIGESRGVWQDLTAATEYHSKAVTADRFAGYQVDRNIDLANVATLSLDRRNTAGDIAALQIKVGPALQASDDSPKPIDCQDNEGYANAKFEEKIAVPLKEEDGLTHKICIRALGKNSNSQKNEPANEVVAWRTSLSDAGILFLNSKRDPDQNYEEISVDPELSLVVESNMGKRLDQRLRYSFNAGEKCSDRWVEQEIVEPVRLKQAAMPNGKLILCGMFQRSDGTWPVKADFQKIWAWKSQAK